MTPRYQWTPASEPPDSDRLVQVWMGNGQWYGAQWILGRWKVWGMPMLEGIITYWRDVNAPDESVSRLRIEPPTEGKG